MVLGFAVAGALPCAAQNLELLKRDLAAARQDVKSHMDSAGAPDTAAVARAAIDREWSLFEDLVAADLDADGKPATDLGVRDLSPAIVPLGTDAYLVSADLDGLGTVFVVQKANGSFRETWSMRDMASGQTVAHPLLGAWRAEAATGACRLTASEPGLCGPLTAEIARLPDDRAGRPRFSINGYYSGQQGSDLGYQLSVWTWAGSKAIPSLAGFYVQTMDLAAPPHFDAPYLRVRTKEDFQTFFVTAPEPGRQTTWDILVDANGVRDMRRT